MSKPMSTKKIPPGQCIILITMPTMQTMTIRAEKIQTPLPICLILEYSIAPMMATTAIRTTAQNIIIVEIVMLFCVASWRMGEEVSP